MMFEKAANQNPMFVNEQNADFVFHCNKEHMQKQPSMLPARVKYVA